MGFTLHLQKWIYTAITRATEFKNVNIYSGKSQVLNEIVLDTYLSKKINGYRQQDKAAKRLISKDNYITMDWLKNVLVLIVNAPLNLYMNIPKETLRAI